MSIGTNNWYVETYRNKLEKSFQPSKPVKIWYKFWLTPSRPGKYKNIFILEKTFSGILNHILLATKGLKIFGQDLEILVTVEREKSAKPEKPAKSEPAAKPTPASAPEVKAESKPHDSEALVVIYYINWNT